jgi:hypothetical protein
LRDCFGESPFQYNSQGTAETQEEEVSGKNRDFLLGAVGLWGAMSRVIVH